MDARACAALLGLAITLQVQARPAWAGPLFPAEALDVGHFSAKAVAIGDFNRDGRPDLAVAGGGVAVFLGMGDGTFGPPARMPAGSYPRSIVVADFNRDNVQDLAVSNEESSSVSVYLGTGNGSFTSQMVVGVTGNPRKLVTGDFNGDGNADLLVPTQSFYAGAVLLGRGDGTFSVSYLALTRSTVAAAVADFNRDGIRDLLLTGNPGGYGDAYVLLGIGDGTFGPAKTIQVDPAFVTMVGAAAGDLNGDGADDFVVTSWSAVYVVLGNGDGTFGPVSRLAIPGFSPGAALIADFDRDGRPDIVLARGTGYRDIAVLPGKGDGTFGPDRRILAGYSPEWVALGDLNGDGGSDLAVANGPGGDVSVLLGGPGGTFGAPVFPVGPEPYATVARDFNGDGISDLAFANHATASVSVILGDGTGSFGALSSFPVGNGPSALAAGYLDHDGVVDLAVANRSGGDLSILFGRGDGGFFGEVRVPAGSAPSHVFVADFDGDTFPDLAVTGADSNDLRILLGSASRTFRLAATYPTGLEPEWVAGGDLNGDGRPDLVVADMGDVYQGGTIDGDLAVFLGEGDGTFSPLRRIQSHRSPRAVAIADLDGDGRPDLAVANPYNLPTVYFGKGDGTFHPETALQVLDAMDDIVIGDFDADGKPDLAYLSSFYEEVQFVPGTGGRAFGRPRRFTTGLDPYDFAAADFNGDDRLDLAVANRASGNVSVPSNAGTPRDTDRDGIRDGLDSCTDVDHDGYGDPGFAANLCPTDNCPAVPNPSQADQDGDDLGDACDTCPLDPSPDADRDGVCGSADNCPTASNPDQEDRDADGQGDACDLDDGVIQITLSDPVTIEWQREAGYDTFNLYRGDIGVLLQTGIYTQTKLSCGQTTTYAFDTTNPASGQALFYMATGDSAGVESGLGSDSYGNPRPNDLPCPHCNRPFTPILHLKISGISTRQTFVIQNATQWCDFWAAVYSIYQPPIPCDTTLVDFTREMALATTEGWQPAYCFDIQFTCVEAGPTGSDLTAYTDETLEGGCACTDTAVTPVDVVKVPLPVSSVAFQSNSHFIDCSP
jgi:VCBS repeat protein/FG-GAP repeat protein